jgi:hypothetical protein
MTTLEIAAVTHLRLLRLERTPQQDRLYVCLAYQHGLAPARIAAESLIPINDVRKILAGADA